MWSLAEMNKIEAKDSEYLEIHIQIKDVYFACEYPYIF